MTENPATTTPSQPESGQRIFKIGTSLITEEASMHNLTSEQIRQLLLHTYPEVAHATLRETRQTDGNLLVEFLPQPGRKG